MIEHLTKELVELTDELVTLREERNEAVDKLCENPDIPKPDAGGLADTIEAALDAAYLQGAEELAAARDAFQAYLVSQNLPANPVRLDDPNLDALREALL